MSENHKTFGLSRREFLIALGGTGCTLALACRNKAVGGAIAAASPTPAAPSQPARYWRAAGAGVVECQLCPRGCTINANAVGFCRTRRNTGGKLTSLVYGHPVTVHTDPIEKKPFNHVLPGSQAFSLACVGCNLTCRHCQNWEISQASPGDLPADDWSPAELVRQARRSGAATIAFTYNEPTVWAEYVLDTAALAKAQGLRTILISNGYIQEAPQRELARSLLAYKIDLKGFSERFYRDVCDGRLQPVLDGMVRVKQEKCWLEIVTLIIPTLNDDSAELKQLAVWVRDNLGCDVPLHFTRFMPLYRLRNLPRTPVSTLEKARQIALDAGLRFVYVGNVPGHPGENTYCPHCQTVLVRRFGMSATVEALHNGKCAKCGETIPGVWA